MVMLKWINGIGQHATERASGKDEGFLVQDFKKISVLPRSVPLSEGKYDKSSFVFTMGNDVRSEAAIFLTKDELRNLKQDISTALSQVDT